MTRYPLTRAVDVELGSFTSFPLSRRVRFAPRAERLLGHPAAVLGIVVVKEAKAA
jgi:hypothetical protein